MYFEITKSPKSVLPFSKQISKNIWIHQSHNLIFQGYRLDEHGGNFLEIIKTESGLQINLSFYKDFCLWQSTDQGILVTNIQCLELSLPQSTIQVTIHDEKITTKQYDLTTCLYPLSISCSKTTVVEQTKRILIENLLQLKLRCDDLYIAYSGGLDSSTLAWIAHQQNIKFTAVIDNRFKSFWPDLPFNCVYIDLIPDSGDCQFEWSGKTVKHFYQIDQCVGGFYGDCTVLHHNDLYHQSSNLTQSDSINSYHPNQTSLLPRFKNTVQLKQGIIKIQSTPHFRHWFDNYEIFDPYRDPRLLATVMQLSLEDLIDQFDQAYIQKIILHNIDVDYHNGVCDYKNDYSKFKIC